MTHWNTRFAAHVSAGAEIWVKPIFGYANPDEHWRQRLEDGHAHNLNLVIGKAVLGLLVSAPGLPAAGPKSRSSTPNPLRQEFG